MGLPSTGKVVDFQAYMLRDIADRYKDHIELVYPKDCVHRMFHDFARNGIVKDFLDSDCDILWFLDSDVVPPTHILDLVVMHQDKWEASGAPYPVFMTQPGDKDRQIVFTVYKGNNGTGMCPTKIPYSGLEFVQGIATGCIFLKRSLLEKMSPPYFEFKYDEEDRRLIQGEDLGFCMKLAKLDIPFFVDYSMVCKHYKDLDLLEMNNYAISYAKKAVEAYDAQVRGQVQALEEKFREQLARLAQSQPPVTKSGIILTGFGR